jgi:hypothetical protein
MTETQQYPPRGQRPPSIPLKPGDRGGSHNLILGDRNRFTQAAFGGLVTGPFNTISNYGASVLSGVLNTASGFRASVSGGVQNTASGTDSVVLGGRSNTVSDQDASVTGGVLNTAVGNASVVLGGVNVTDNNDNSVAPQPPFP